MITKEQYEAAKKIVELYEHEQYLEEQDYEDYDDYDETDWFEEQEEMEEEEMLEKALTCTCGAYVVSEHSGRGIHVADCFCGAD